LWRDEAPSSDVSSRSFSEGRNPDEAAANALLLRARTDRPGKKGLTCARAVFRLVAKGMLHWPRDAVRVAKGLLHWGAAGRSVAKELAGAMGADKPAASVLVTRGTDRPAGKELGFCAAGRMAGKGFRFCSRVADRPETPQLGFCANRLEFWVEMMFCAKQLEFCAVDADRPAAEIRLCCPLTAFVETPLSSRIKKGNAAAVFDGVAPATAAAAAAAKLLSREGIA